MISTRFASSDWPRPVNSGSLWGILVTAIVLVWTARVLPVAGPGNEPAPLPRYAASDHWADETSCRDCHEQAETFPHTGHFNTLSRATAPDSLKSLQSFASAPPEAAGDVSLTVTEETVDVLHHVNGTSRRATLDWCFGSGRHARTWVGLLDDSWGMSDLIEYRWTQYHAINGFDITPGQSAHADPTAFEFIGLLFDEPKARRCFACHATRLSVESGHLDQSSIHPGVRCQRCHGPRGRHVDSDGVISHDRVSDLTPLESIHRCAECHRRAEDQPPEDIREDNPEIARFQPVGLVQSACFQKSDSLTCTTCHDPHRSLESQDSLGIWQCVQCHAPQRPHPVCAAGESDDCLSCHMPKVRGEAPLDFTDHWIRVRKDHPRP